MGLVVMSHRYVLEGGFHHKDSAGNEGNLRDGWVQWMTAGSGVVHSEMPTGESRHSPSRQVVSRGEVGFWSMRRQFAGLDGVGPRVRCVAFAHVCGRGSLVCAAELLRDGGRLEGFQLWVNLPAKDKMVPPRSVPSPARHVHPLQRRVAREVIYHP